MNENILERSLEALETTTELLGTVDIISKRLAELEKTVLVLIRQNIALEAVVRGHQKAWEKLIENEEQPPPKTAIN